MTTHEAVAAEVRAEMARQQLSGVKAARELGWTQHYISTRLRGSVPFDVADLLAIAQLLKVAPGQFFETARDIRRPGFFRPLADLPLCACGHDLASHARRGASPCLAYGCMCRAWSLVERRALAVAA